MLQGKIIYSRRGNRKSLDKEKQDLGSTVSWHLGCGKQGKWLPSKIHFLILGTYELSYRTKDVIKLRILRGRAYLGLPKSALDAITCIPIRGRQQAVTLRHTEEMMW